MLKFESLNFRNLIMQAEFVLTIFVFISFLCFCFFDFIYTICNLTHSMNLDENLEHTSFQSITNLTEHIAPIQCYKIYGFVDNLPSYDEIHTLQFTQESQQ